jgi:hypothetical protein
LRRSRSSREIEAFVVSLFQRRRRSRSNLVHVGTVVVLTTGKTTTTGVLAVLAYTSMTVGDVAAAVGRKVSIPYSISPRVFLSPA